VPPLKEILGAEMRGTEYFKGAPCRARCAYANDLCAGQPSLTGLFSNTEAQEAR
jgi:hypothetical protein